MDAECTRLVNLLGTGEKERQTRENLSIQLGLSDRKLRKLIEQCQNEGVPICNTSNGYYKAESLEKLYHYIRRERKRADAIDKKCDAMLFTEWFD